MDNDKQTLTFNQPLKDETIKLQNDRSINRIENFSTELFVTIFGYLNCYDIYEAFSNLNYRFQQLLNSSFHFYKVRSNKATFNETFTNNYKQFLHLNSRNIFSMRLWASLENGQFLLSLITDSSMSSLESLHIFYIDLNQLVPILNKLTALSRLFSLSIIIDDTDENVDQIYQLILALPKLKSISLTINSIDSQINLLTYTKKQQSTIEYLSINHRITIGQLFDILAYYTSSSSYECASNRNAQSTHPS
ncbi:unnamed protein product [Rotaria sp. Silwood2]|nr:unnamed protein product [Rotaria sp. Silwood2]